MLLTFCSLMDTTKKHQLENHLQRLRTSSLHNIQMVIFFLKEHTVITNTICILFSPNRTFFQIWRIPTKNHINLFTYKVKRGTNWDWGCNLSSKNKCLMTIIHEKKLFRKLSIHNTTPFCKYKNHICCYFPYLVFIAIMLLVKPGLF